jgi:hypothetical protein
MNSHAELSNNILILENERIRREFRWNDGNLCSKLLLDQRSGKSWEFNTNVCDCSFPGEEGKATKGQLTITEQPDRDSRPGYLKVEVTFRLNRLEVRRVFRLYENCPAIACDYYLRGQSQGLWRAESVSLASQGNIEDPELLLAQSKPASILERLELDHRHVTLQAVEFFEITDYRNNLLKINNLLPYIKPEYIAGNLLLAIDALNHGGFFILKESPSAEAQLAYPGFDFICHKDQIQLAGIGLDPVDLHPQQWTRAYGFVTGVASGTKDDLLLALRSYQDCIRRRHEAGDRMILLNTWGDRSQNGRIGEDFALAELQKAQGLGLTHFCLDDGWQQGLTPNSGLPGGTFKGIWDRPDYWQVNRDRFPHGLEPVVAKSKDTGVKMALWFNPSPDGDYAHWQNDADVLIAMYKKYGIRVFKIDGVNILNKAADRNMRALLDRVVEATDHRAIFNLDVTAGRRYGYHYFNEYGNLFLENRYSDWGNYYPHWTLRNLWMLSRYLPTQSLQIEFLNKWRNPEKYPPNDPLAPRHIPWAYCFAVTMMAQPLAWFEASHLPEEAFELQPILETYKRCQEQIHAGQIMPIGEEPTGASWTGFQSLGQDHGFVLIFREKTPRASATMKLWNLAEGQDVHFKSLLGQGQDFTATVDAGGSISFFLPQTISFALFEYRCNKEV